MSAGLLDAGDIRNPYHFWIRQKRTDKRIDLTQLRRGIERSMLEEDADAGRIDGSVASDQRKVSGTLPAPTQLVMSRVDKNHQGPIDSLDALS